MGKNLTSKKSSFSTPAQLIRLSLELIRRTKKPINHCVIQLFLSYIKGWTTSAQPIINIIYQVLLLAASARAVKAAASLTAKSASILRLTSISANFKPCINCEYESPFKRAAALIRVIHNLRKSVSFDDGHGMHSSKSSLLVLLQYGTRYV